MNHACCCLKKNRQPCSIEGDRNRGGKWYCHIHDPRGNFQTNNPSYPEVGDTDETPDSVETLAKKLDLLTLRVEALEHENSRLRDGPVLALATDDCPFTPT